jgi:DNA-binding response OmpR family regulator
MFVLLVDDDDLVRTVLTAVLEDAGHKVVETYDPRKALDLAGTVGPPNIVITDIDLGSTLNGFEVAANAHELWPDVRVILISGLPADHTAQTLDPRDYYIQKPFSGDHLLGTIEHLVNGA